MRIHSAISAVCYGVQVHVMYQLNAHDHIVNAFVLHERVNEVKCLCERKGETVFGNGNDFKREVCGCVSGVVVCVVRNETFVFVNGVKHG